LVKKIQQMLKNKIPKKVPEVPPLKKNIEAMPIIDPEEAIIPEEIPDFIQEENPFENPDPYELPEPGEGP
jgi:hypothetical protein